MLGKQFNNALIVPYFTKTFILPIYLPIWHPDFGKKRLYFARIFAKLHNNKELAALHSIYSSSGYKGQQKHTQEPQTHTHQDAGFFLKRNFQMDMTPL